VKIIRKIVFYLNIFLAFITLLAYISPFINPAIFWGLSFLGLIVPVLLFLNLIFSFYWLITSWKKSWLSILVLLVGAHYFSLSFSLSKHKNLKDVGFSIASFNMNYAFNTYRDGTYRYDKTKTIALVDFIKNDINADILCGQETNKHIKGLIVDIYPYLHILENTGTSIYSKYPIIKSGFIDFGTKTNSCVWADIQIHTDTIRVYSAHLQSNNITDEAHMVMEEAEKKQKLNFNNIKSILGKYKKYVGIRANQAKLIDKHIGSSPFPVILGADLNDPPVSYVHRVLSGDMQDAFKVAGNGLGSTYAGNIPLLRIDNIILSKNFVINSHQTFYQKHSDHYPVKSTVSFN